MALGVWIVCWQTIHTPKAFVTIHVGGNYSPGVAPMTKASIFVSWPRQ